MSIENSRSIKQSKPLPSSFPLGPTLASRVQQLREFRNMTVRDLAGSSRFSIERIEDIEAGLETWLSTTERQRLAKALSIEPARLQQVEYRARRFANEDDTSSSEGVHQQLTESILSGARDLECPDCGSTLKCSIQEGIDIEGMPTYFAKAYCLKCPFILR